MIVCSACRLEIRVESEAEEKLYATKTGDVISMIRHDACAPKGGSSLWRISREDLKTYLSPAVTRKNALAKRRRPKLAESDLLSFKGFHRPAAKAAQ